MTTSESPRHVLRAQAATVANGLKGAERIRANGKDDVVVGVAMDDKIVKMTFRWDYIRDMDEDALTDFILGHMSGSAAN